MKKRLSILLVLTLVFALFSGCTGTTVVYSPNIIETTPGSTPAPETSASSPETSTPSAGAVKTGLAILPSIAESKSASAEAEGEAKYDVSIIAVTVTDEGIIESCIIDSIPASVKFNAAGAVTSDLTAAISTKNELGENYGMKAYGNAKYEWNEQVAALAAYAEGKTVEQLRKGAITEAGMAADADLASTATIYLGGFVSGIEAAVANAAHLGAQSGDQLTLASLSKIDSSTSAEGENMGTAQLDADVTAMTMNGDTITSCYIDSLQAKVEFDTAGTITTDLNAPVLTKNQLGENYGMKAYGNAVAEWNEQAASFAAYVTGKTAADVTGIAVNEKTAPTDADLASSVTISIGGFQALIAKAAASGQ